MYGAITCLNFTCDPIFSRYKNDVSRFYVTVNILN